MAKATGKKREKNVNGSGKAKKGPRSQVLPGMTQVRSITLDHVCEEIAEEREALNKAQTTERGLKSKALEVMQTANISIYKHAGVELARTPGADKLRIRLVSDDGDASVTGGETSQGASEGDASDDKTLQ